MLLFQLAKARKCRIFFTIQLEKITEEVIDRPDDEFDTDS